MPNILTVNHDKILNLGGLMLPKGFTYLNDARFILSLDYFTAYNFIGRPVAGYEAKVCILTEPAATALIKVQDELDAYKAGYRLKIFDTYRPVQAVADFVQWAKEPDEKMKATFYPNVAKSELFKKGYIAQRSAHSRGSTVDLTIAISHDSQATPIELDMGTTFDYFDEKAHTNNSHISDAAKKNRELLKQAMEKHGFVNYSLEWWHFTLNNEPFPDTYFDFPVN
jgi:D-alanyl-D-alanine dipeptidase